MHKIFLILIASFFSVFTGRVSAAPSECKLEYVIIQFTTACGEDPPKLEINSDLLASLAESLVKKAITDELSVVKAILEIGQLMSTDNIFRSVHIIYAYRFIHQGKPSRWIVGRRNNICDSNGVDFFIPVEVNRVGKETYGKILAELQKEFNDECEAHKQQ